MLCAGDLESAIKACDIEKTNETNLITIVCNQLYKDIDNKKIDLESIKLKTYKDYETKQQAIIKCENEINDMINKIENVKRKINEENMDPITFCDIEIPTIIKCCNQKFDFESIMIYITSTNTPKCPLCRTDITKDSLIIIDNTPTIEELIDEEESKEEEEEKDEIYNTEDFNKFDNFKYLVSKKIDTNGQIIIFSKYDNTFKPMCTILDDLNIEYRYLKGHSTTIKNNLTWHSEITNQKKVLFLNTQHAGAGLNIHWTTDIILFHNLDKDLEMQTIGRANRYPRTTSVNVHKLVYKDQESI
jgi:hypothetical protein